MARVKGGTVTRQHHREILKEASGFNQGRRRLYRRANEAVLKARAYAYRDRRNKKRDFRSLWIQRINAAARLNGSTYGRLMHALGQSDIRLDRKMLADLAVRDPEAFAEVVKTSKAV
jgi:large subunit ribosomal protein L20